MQRLSVHELTLRFFHHQRASSIDTICFFYYYSLSVFTSTRSNFLKAARRCGKKSEAPWRRLVPAFKRRCVIGQSPFRFRDFDSGRSQGTYPPFFKPADLQGFSASLTYPSHCTRPDGFLPSDHRLSGAVCCLSSVNRLYAVGFSRLSHQLSAGPQHVFGQKWVSAATSDAYFLCLHRMHPI